MRLADLLPALGPVSVDGPVDRPVDDIVHDSRQAGPRSIFAALPGQSVDGRRFVPGLDCAAVLAEGPVEARPGVTVLRVPHARAAFAQAAAALAGWPGQAIPVVGVTGTNGKTTTTFLIGALAEAHGWPAAVIGTTGHRVAGRAVPSTHTTPEAPVLQGLLAAARDAGCGVVAMEVSSIGLDMRRVEGIPFRVAAWTSFSRDHLDYHGTMEAYQAAKARLFDTLLAPDGTAVLFSGLPFARALPLRAGARRWTYGRAADDTVRLVRAVQDLGGAWLDVDTPAGRFEARTHLLGGHNVENVLCAMAVGLSLGLPPSAIQAGLFALAAVPGRLERVPNALGVHIFVDYAHTPDALTQVLGTLRPLCHGRLLTVMGCGGDRDAGKRPLMGAAAGEGSDAVYLTSDNPRSEDPLAILAQIRAGTPGAPVVEPDRAAAIARAIADARPGDVVLIAGKGHETTQTIGTTVLPFDDRAVAADAAAALRPEPR